LRALPESWDATGFEVALTAKGDPMLDLKLSRNLGCESGIEVTLDGVIDVVIYTDVGDLGVLDVKSSAIAHTPLYTVRSDQLTSYQTLVEGNADSLGLPPLRKLGFWDFLKRKASSRVEPPLLVALRRPQELADFRQKCFWIAEDILRKRFPKASRLQFNTPCELCDFAQHCVYGDEDGLVFPASVTQKTA
ncbi:MAG: PD-(D/E)XK nuclease family protein, partial [Steroidobacteraceae bacterium]